MDKEAVKEVLTNLLSDIADKARADAQAGESDIGSIFRREGNSLQALDIKTLDKAIANIDKATATQEGARRLMNGVIMAASIAARLA
tara:strand:+ start:1050 stop:1310 length:261 start_codon:yes stop_codon:yes gene_type:complete